MATRNSLVRELLTRAGEPTTREAGLLEATTQVRVLAHHAPDQRATVVLDHRQDCALIDAEVVAGDPAELGDVLAVPERNVEREGSVERVEKAVLRRQSERRGNAASAATSTSRSTGLKK
jgi:hypothetical protein